MWLCPQYHTHTHRTKGMLAGACRVLHLPSFVNLGGHTVVSTADLLYVAPSTPCTEMAPVIPAGWWWWWWWWCECVCGRMDTSMSHGCGGRAWCAVCTAVQTHAQQKRCMHVGEGQTAHGRVNSTRKRCMHARIQPAAAHQSAGAAVAHSRPAAATSIWPSCRPR